jgi:hypothetical protein
MQQRVISAIVSLAVALGLYWVAFGTGPRAEPELEPSAQPGPAPEPVVRRVVPLSDPAPEPAPEPAPPPASAEPLPQDPAWGPLHGRLQRVLAEGVDVDVPVDATRYEAFDLKMDAVDRRTTELDALIVEFTALAETSTDPLTRVDALTSLGETYQALSDTLADTPVPDWERPRARRRLEADLEVRQAIADDKARMVYQMAQQEVGASGVPLGTDLSRRLATGLESTRAH